MLHRDKRRLAAPQVGRVLVSRTCTPQDRNPPTAPSIHWRERFSRAMAEALPQNVRVAVRVRPQTPKENLEHQSSCLRVYDDERQIVVGKDRAFTFDFVFNEQSCALPCSSSHRAAPRFTGPSWHVHFARQDTATSLSRRMRAARRRLHEWLQRDRLRLWPDRQRQDVHHGQRRHRRRSHRRPGEAWCHPARRRRALRRARRQVRHDGQHRARFV